MAYAAGVDVGSTQTKAVVINEAKEIVGRALIDTGANVIVAAEQAFAAAINGANVQEEEVEYVVGTGYGRYRVTFGNAQVTEISCHGRGAVHMFPGTRTVIDMGGQDTKAIRVRPSGEIVDFCMNDKCAAGTGRFLGAASSALDIPLDQLGPTALRAERPVRISTTCTVFAESEVLSWLGKGKKNRRHSAGRSPIDCCAFDRTAPARGCRGADHLYRWSGAKHWNDRGARAGSLRQAQCE